MTAYTDTSTIDTSSGTPITEQKLTALKDNPVAITEGAAGAPEIQTAALIAGEQMNTTNVLSATAAAAVGAIGTYAFLVTIATVGNNPGTTTVGSNLEYAGLETNDGTSTWTKIIQSGTSPSGTWQLMGFGGTNGRASLWLRIS
jgi:hypothetical protein